ncbi:syntaxin-7-like [Saccoglossus kowalevskii]
MNRGEFGSYGAVDNDGSSGAPGNINTLYGHGGGGSYQGIEDDFQDLVDQASSNIYKINNNASALEKTLRQIGTSTTDSKALRDKIHHTQQVTNTIVNKTSKLLKTLANASRKKTKQQRLQVDRLGSDFKSAVRGYSTTQKKVAEKLKISPEPPAMERLPPDGYGGPGAFDDYGDDKAALMEEESRRQHLAQLQEQEQVIEFDQALMEEREDRIRQIEADILDVNQIFRDLASLVYEQGEMVDTIEANVEKAYDNVESGNVQLHQASRYQGKYLSAVSLLSGVVDCLFAADNLNLSSFQICKWNAH